MFHRERIVKLKERVNEALEMGETDEIIKTMQENTETQQYAQRRISELVEGAIQVDQELHIERLTRDNLVLLAKVEQFKERDGYKQKEIDQYSQDCWQLKKEVEQMRQKYEKILTSSQSESQSKHQSESTISKLEQRVQALEEQKGELKQALQGKD